MRNPYIAGRWVRGANHYGRQRLLDHLLHKSNDAECVATWLVGTRRMGKTSLLRQLEFLTDLPDSHLVPLFWDFQGCSTPQDLSDELYFALEEVQERFETYGVEVEELEGLDAIKMLRKLKKPLRQAGKNLFLLIDEAEVLLEIGNRDPKWLARLRKALQNDNLHTLITSTKLLSQLNHMSDSWNTSPFLLGFNLVNLWSLDLHAASALVCQEQAEHLQITIPQEMLDNILTYTNRHPYLIQYLCQQLFEVDKTGRGYLRAIQDDDLIPDQLVEGFFQIDFGQLTNIERRILLSVASFSMATDDDLLTALSDEHPERIRTFTYGLNKLGHLRNVYDRWTIGNADPIDRVDSATACCQWICSGRIRSADHTLK